MSNLSHLGKLYSATFQNLSVANIILRSKLQRSRPVAKQRALLCAQSQRCFQHPRVSAFKRCLGFIQSSVHAFQGLQDVPAWPRTPQSSAAFVLPRQIGTTTNRPSPLAMSRQPCPSALAGRLVRLGTSQAGH